MASLTKHALLFAVPGAATRGRHHCLATRAVLARCNYVVAVLLLCPVPPCVVWFASGYACVPACTNEADEGRAMQRTGRWYTRCPVACSRHQRLLGAKSGIPRCSEWVHTLRYPHACLTAPAGQQGSHQLRGQRFLPKMCVTWAHLLKNDPGAA